MITLDKVLISNEEIQARAKVLADKILKDFDSDLTIISVLKGSVFWLNDIVKYFPTTLTTTLDFIQTSSYGNNTSSSGKIKLIKDITTDIIDRDVLIIEDIIDTGYTMRFIVDHLIVMKPKKLKVCVMLNKQARRKVTINADYVGFEIDDVFVAGHGLDPKRHLPDVYQCIDQLSLNKRID